VTIAGFEAVPGFPGAGASSGELQKLTIYYQQGTSPVPGQIEALFNPSEISVTRSVWWDRLNAVGQGGGTPAVVQEFRSVAADTITIDLFFDTYERPAAGLGAADVRRHTGRIAGLADVTPQLHRPPVCSLRWGLFDIFTGVLTSLSQRFTLFLPNGTPVRATLTCEFTQVTSWAHARAGELQSADVIKTRLVRRYDTLQSLAADEYGDPALWRPIAEANGIVRPRDLQPGTVLTIPRIGP